MPFQTLFNFANITKSDFVETLKILWSIYKASSTISGEQTKINNLIIETIEASGNIEIRWINGMFYPEGEPFLDKELVESTLIILEKHPKEKKDLLNALKNYQEKNIESVIDKCYIVLEGFFKDILKNDKTLMHNKTDIANKLNWGNEWGKIVHSFFTFANDYRHASENRHEIKIHDIESSIYMTCLLIRKVEVSFREII